MWRVKGRGDAGGTNESEALLEEDRSRGLSELDLMILDLFHYFRKHSIVFHSLSPVLLKRKRRLNNNRKTNENRVSWWQDDITLK